MPIGIKKGFSLLETIIAIAILTLAMTAVFTLVSRGIRSISLASNEMTAYFLASEALEFIRNTRDGNLLADDPPRDAFDPDIFAVCETFEGCVIDVHAKNNDGSIEYCSGGICPPIRFNRESGIYNHDPPTSANENTIFTRQLHMTCRLPCAETDPQEFEVRVVVTWQQLDAPRTLRSFALSVGLFDTAF
ncbi:MAG: type II secretion system protein [Candidatus Niyogibacteria bacterium]|nr:type II secretion system protein [Candidatus Niyogibacteria bacterium]